ncbi:Mrr restriction system protein-like protein (plasmid) [Haloferax mediterranei ATCC 33500]|uniref:Mrr restriction system protein-like protein n=1 Tax=Haloferax mediterranei (strain ATCC 33500 / DSM 1411 / JCM 8866 / NBRC 14739 / NCIMB 2177 / R-4) TaxID=523841 RepID=I3R954_HALMT|nr:Mrr restriction system protein-like protein [Haloferax mediterranei ATCC 33500]
MHCEKEDANSYIDCANCESINCGSHIKTEQLEGTPVCTGCAVTERFTVNNFGSGDPGLVSVLGL